MIDHSQSFERSGGLSGYNAHSSDGRNLETDIDTESYAHGLNRRLVLDILTTRVSLNDAEVLATDLENLRGKIWQQVLDGTLLPPTMPVRSLDESIERYIESLVTEMIPASITEAIQLGFEDRILTVAPFASMQVEQSQALSRERETIEDLQKDLKAVRLLNAVNLAHARELIARLADTPEKRALADEIMGSSMVVPELFVSPAIEDATQTTQMEPLPIERPEISRSRRRRFAENLTRTAEIIIHKIRGNEASEREKVAV